jgi:hypothetical protein
MSSVPLAAEKCGAKCRCTAPTTTRSTSPSSRPGPTNSLALAPFLFGSACQLFCRSRWPGSIGSLGTARHTSHAYSLLQCPGRPAVRRVLQCAGGSGARLHGGSHLRLPECCPHGMVFARTGDGELAKLRRENGRERWRGRKRFCHQHGRALIPELTADLHCIHLLAPPGGGGRRGQGPRIAPRRDFRRLRARHD